jgi:hypothetical protein
MPEAAEGPTVLRILLGTQLRRLRESRGISAQVAAKAIRGSESKISRKELGRNAIRKIDVLDHPVRHERPAVPGGFTILRFAEPDLPDVAYVEHLTGALYFDKKSEVDRYLLTMERVSIVAAKPNRTPGTLTALIDELSEER